MKWLNLNWEDYLYTGTDIFGKINEKLKQEIKKNREILRELENGNECIY